MSAGRFVAAVFAVGLALAAAVAGINVWIDFYGLYGDARGEERTIATNDRFGKYLYAFNHIPANYDALLVGSSVSANFDVRRLEPTTMYNLSLSAANIADQKLILDKALENGSYRVVVVILNPYLVRGTAQKGGDLGPSAWWSGLGSLPLFEDYAVRAAEQAGLYAPRFTPWGSEVFVPGHASFDGAEHHRRFLARSEPADLKSFGLDEEALALLDEALQGIRRSGTPVIGVFPPVYRERYDDLRPAYAEFEQRVSALFEDDDLLVDLMDGRLDDVARDPKSFLGAHYSRSAVAEIEAVLAEIVEERLAELEGS